MTDANRNQWTPVAAFLRKYGLVAGISAALLVGVGTFAANAMQTERTAAPAPAPSIVNSTATLDSETAVPTASPGSTAGEATGAPSAAPAGSGGGQSGAGAGAAAGAAPGQPTGGSGSSVPSPKPTTAVTLGTANQAPTIQDWHPIAEKFSAAWANPSIGKDAWLAAMKPYATAQLLTALSRADIRNVPQDTLYNVRSVKHDERTWVFNPVFTSGKDRFGASITVQNDGTWLVDHVGAPQ